MFLNESQINNFPVRHLSVSAIRTYLTDRQAFKKRYILLEFDDFTPSPALVEGKIFHQVIETFWIDFKNGFKESEDAIKKMCELFDKEYTEEVKNQFKVTPSTWNYNFYLDKVITSNELDGVFDKIDFGKTGSKEKSIKVITNLVEFYFQSIEKMYDFENISVLEIEGKFTGNIDDLENNPLPVALKGFCDLVIENKDGEVIIIDHKTVTNFNTHEDFFKNCNLNREEFEELGIHDPVYELQAACYWFLVRKFYGKNPTRMEFHQIKKSKNKDGGDQFYVYKVDFNSKMIKRFLEIYTRIVKELVGIPLIDEQTGIMQFLPNPFQQFGWIDAWVDFCKEVDTGSSLFLEEVSSKKLQLVDEIEAIDL